MDWALTGATIGLIIAFCYLLDWLVSKKEEDKQKVMIIKWWSQLDDFNYGEAVRKSNIFCNEIFDKIYGKRHWSQRCFGISCCTSLLSVSVLTVVNMVPSAKVLDSYEPYLYIGGGLMLATLTNVWIDYISLIETRLILKFASQVRPPMLPMLLVLDLFFSAAIFAVLLSVLPCVFLWDEAGEILAVIFRSETFIWNSDDVIENTLTVLFYSTFSTSIIFYIYCLSTLLFKFVKLSKTRLMIVLEKLEESDHLFKAIGGLLAAVMVFVKAVVEIIQYIA